MSIKCEVCIIKILDLATMMIPMTSKTTTRYKSLLHWHTFNFVKYVKNTKIVKNTNHLTEMAQKTPHQSEWFSCCLAGKTKFTFWVQVVSYQSICTISDWTWSVLKCTRDGLLETRRAIHLRVLVLLSFFTVAQYYLYKFQRILIEWWNHCMSEFQRNRKSARIVITYLEFKLFRTC